MFCVFLHTTFSTVTIAFFYPLKDISGDIECTSVVGKMVVVAYAFFFVLATAAVGGKEERTTREKKEMQETRKKGCPLFPKNRSQNQEGKELVSQPTHISLYSFTTKSCALLEFNRA